MLHVIHLAILKCSVRLMDTTGLLFRHNCFIKLLQLGSIDLVLIFGQFLNLGKAALAIMCNIWEHTPSSSRLFARAAQSSCFMLWAMTKSSTCDGSMYSYLMTCYCTCNQSSHCAYVLSVCYLSEIGYCGVWLLRQLPKSSTSKLTRQRLSLE